MEENNQSGISRMNNSDIDDVVDVHLSSLPGYFLSELGKNFLKAYYEGLSNNRRGITLVFRDDKGEVLGFTTGVIDPSGFYSDLLKKSWYRFLLAAIPAVLKNPRIIPRLLRAFNKPVEASSGDQFVEWTSWAVRPTAESKGIGRKLAKGFDREARSRGCSDVILYVDKYGNDKVNRFHQSCGFKLSKTFTTKEGRVMNEYRKHLS